MRVVRPIWKLFVEAQTQSIVGASRETIKVFLFSIILA